MIKEPQKPRLCRGISIRGALIALFVLMLLVLGSVFFYVGYYITNRSAMEEAQRQIRQNLRSAWVQYDNHLQQVHHTVYFVTLMQYALRLFRGQETDIEQRRKEFERIRKLHKLDMLTFVDRTSKVFLRTRAPYVSGDRMLQNPVTVRAQAGKSASGTVILSPTMLEQEGEGLAERARIMLLPTPMAVKTEKKVEDHAMALMAAVPVHETDGTYLGMVYGGKLLNRNSAIPDTIRDTIFENVRYKGKAIGNVTIFQGDLRIATNVRTGSGQRAIGTRISRPVYRRTLKQGRSYSDRAFVVNDWYLTAYEPIRDLDGGIIGVLYVGILERKYVDMKNHQLRLLTVLMAAGLLLALVLAFSFAFWMARPIRALTTTAAALAQGDMTARTGRAGPFTETQKVTSVFNQMADAIVQREKDLIVANRQWRGTCEQLSRLNHNYMDMLEFVAHELKSPLSSMIFALQSMKEGYLGAFNEAQQKMIDSIERNAEYLNEMILNYLNLSSIEKDELTFEPEPVYLKKDVVEPVATQVHRQLEANEMKLSVTIPDDVFVLGDSDLLRIVMDNLLSNAIKYGERGTSIDVTHEAAKPGFHRFSVFNKGRGIYHDDMDKLFMKFSRLGQAKKSAKKGTGLGLFITKDIIEKHQGKIWAESEEGQWARFLFELPSGGSEPAES